MVINLRILYCQCLSNVLVNKRLGLQNISQLQFQIKLATELLLTADEEELMEEEAVSDSGRDPGDDRRMNGLPHVAGHHHVIIHSKKVARRCKVCHKSTVKMCHRKLLCSTAQLVQNINKIYFYYVIYL